MLEAMSTGLPVLATRHGGIPEAVRDGEDGILVAEQDHQALADAMRALADNPARWRSMGRAASESMQRNFEQRSQIEHLESCYREVAAMEWSPPVADPVLD